MNARKRRNRRRRNVEAGHVARIEALTRRAEQAEAERDAAKAQNARIIRAGRRVAIEANRTRDKLRVAEARKLRLVPDEPEQFGVEIMPGAMVQVSGHQVGRSRVLAFRAGNDSAMNMKVLNQIREALRQQNPDSDDGIILMPVSSSGDLTGPDLRVWRLEPVLEDEEEGQAEGTESQDQIPESPAPVPPGEDREPAPQAAV